MYFDFWCFPTLFLVELRGMESGSCCFAQLPFFYGGNEGWRFCKKDKKISSSEEELIDKLKLSFLNVSSLKTALALLDIKRYFLNFVK